MNSRTSRPRSPTRASTATSQAVCRASMASSVDLPTPEPANRPRRWPSPAGGEALSARTPRSSRRPSRARRVASGGAARSASGSGPAAAAACRPAAGRAGRSPGRASRRTPASEPFRQWPARRRRRAPRCPGRGRRAGAKGMACALPSRNPTISAGTPRPSRGMERQPVADRQMVGQPVHIDDKAGQAANPALQPQRRHGANAALQDEARAARLVCFIGSIPAHDRRIWITDKPYW